MNIAEKRRIRAKEQKSLYQRAAEKFNADYYYVAQIARGARKGLRGNGKKIREWMEQEVSRTNAEV